MYVVWSSTVAASTGWLEWEDETKPLLAGTIFVTIPPIHKLSYARYEKYILSHAGVHLIEPELFREYDPKKKVFHQKIELTHDFEPFEAVEVEISSTNTATSAISELAKVANRF
ncbi:hypothetical protein EW026_g8099 [Hermanssonia centrifuga]|uniref:Uncharacterized protein n=1 Tax=Hermanssonia centrifuga TaxID=98765 RepID=A0A4S4K5H6_9APHY|nr:hypothetical protein EW026_g8099 [Hermanssonia centrifuga]